MGTHVKLCGKHGKLKENIVTCEIICNCGKICKSTYENMWNHVITQKDAWKHAKTVKTCEEIVLPALAAL